MSQKMITLYDIPSTLPGQAWSTNTWKARFVLNYKGIPYKTEWVEYPDIEPHAKKLGIPPTGVKLTDGTPWYTLPAIHDPSTGAFVSDSLLIAQYLDKTYPETPKAIPHNTDAFQLEFSDLHFQKHLPFWQFFIKSVCTYLNPASQEYFIRSREMIFGATWENMKPTGDAGAAQWNAYKDGLSVIDSYMSKTDDRGPYVMGDIISFADFVVASYCIGSRMVWGEDSEEWKEVATWHNGRWGRYADIFKAYQIVKL